MDVVERATSVVRIFMTETRATLAMRYALLVASTIEDIEQRKKFIRAFSAELKKVTEK